VLNDKAAQSDNRMKNMLVAGGPTNCLPAISYQHFHEHVYLEELLATYILYFSMIELSGCKAEQLIINN
jgi:predicted SAM-dependent methyltransferase